MHLSKEEQKILRLKELEARLLDRKYPRTLITFDIQKVRNIPKSELSKTGREYTSLCDNLQSEPPRYIYLYE